MRLHENQAKSIFAENGIPTPEGEIATTPEEVEKIAEKLGDKIAVKAQVHVGGRGKAGGIKIVSSPKEAVEASRDMLDKELKGEPIEKVLIEEAVSIDQELYLGITLDRSEGKTVAMASSKGGVNIEEVAENNPEAVSKTYIDPAYGFHDYQAREILYNANFPEETINETFSILKKLFSIWESVEAEEAEINPLILTEEGKLMAVDAVLNLDDSALFRHENLAKLKEEVYDTDIKKKASQLGLDYVSLDGNIGVVGNGAGLVMTTLDLIDYFGGYPANFLDIGGGADEEKMSQAISLVMEDEKVDSVLVNIFGGITRCDEIARGVNSAIPEEIPKPIVVRLSGTNQKKGREILSEKVEEEKELESAIKRVIELAGRE